SRASDGRRAPARAAPRDVSPCHRRFVATIRAWYVRCSPSCDPCRTDAMDADPRHSNGDHDLASSEYRSRLLTKLNCLISVLEAAIAKVTKGLEAPDANEERLVRIRANLENTLAICTRARRS